MRSFLTTLTIVFALGLGFVWKWGLDHRLYYLSRDYALLTGKKKLIENSPRPALIIFGDSIVLDGVQPEQLGQAVINFGMNGSTPIESYFLIRNILKSPALPAAVILSYNAYHFVHPDFYWENTVKFGLISGPEAGEVMDRIIRYKDKELLSGSGIWNLEQRLYSFLLSRGFPSYYLSSFLAEPLGVRKKDNEAALKVIAKTRGQYYFPLADGSHNLNADTQLKAFTISPVVDYYFRETIKLLNLKNIPVYFYTMPVNEASVPFLDSSVTKAYREYIEVLKKENPPFRVLSKWRTIYPWRLFSDHAHLNEKGTSRFNREFARILNNAGVPGGPFGPPHSLHSGR